MANVHFIEYDGKKYPVRLGNYSINLFQQQTGLNLNDAANDISIYEPLLFFALGQGARAAKQELVLTEDDMMFVLDECMDQFIELIPKFFPEKTKEIEEAIKKAEKESKEKVAGGKKKK